MKLSCSWLVCLPLKSFLCLFRLLAETGDSVELVEASDMVPGLKFRQGITKWVVSDKIGNIYKQFSEVPEKIHSLIRPTMFPPPPEEAEQFHMVIGLLLLHTFS